MEEKLTKSVEDYLEAIYVIEITGNGIVHSLQVAKNLNVSKAAVSRAMDKLIEDGFVEKHLYGDIHLTEKGREIGSKVYEKHTTIKQFLLNIGVSEENAEIDCCKIEHTICNETFEQIKKFNENCKKAC